MVLLTGVASLVEREVWSVQGPVFVAHGLSRGGAWA